MIVVALVQAQNTPFSDPFPSFDPSQPLDLSPPLGLSPLSQPVKPSRSVNPSSPQNICLSKCAMECSPLPMIYKVCFRLCKVKCQIPTLPVNPSPPQNTCIDECVTKTKCPISVPILYNLCYKSCEHRCQFLGAEYLYNCTNFCVQSMPTNLKSGTYWNILYPYSFSMSYKLQFCFFFCHIYSLFYNIRF